MWHMKQRSLCSGGKRGGVYGKSIADKRHNSETPTDSRVVSYETALRRIQRRVTWCVACVLWMWFMSQRGLNSTVCVFYRLIHPQQCFRYKLPKKNNGVQRESHGCSSSGASGLGKIKHLDASHSFLRAASRPAVAHYDTEHFGRLSP